MSDPLNLETVRIKIEGHVAVGTMDNPPSNAQNITFMDDMMACFDYLSDLSAVRAVVLTGAGKCFSAGADIKGRAGKERDLGEGWQHSRRARESYHAIRECRKPVVGAINGPALGAGLAVAASCDILFVAEEARVGLPEIDVGLLGGGRHAMRLFDHSTVRRMMFTGYRMTGAEMYRRGIVEACLPQVDLLPAALAMAEDIASKSPVAMTLAKQSLNTIEELSLRDGYRHEQNMTAELSKYEDSKEAMLAFAEKRKPVFKGR